MSMTDEELLYSIFGRFLPRKGVCALCFPNHEEELMLKSGMRNYDGTWKDENGRMVRWSKDLFSKYQAFKLDYEKDKISTVIDIDSELYFCVCKKHLLDMIESMNEFDRGNQ